MDRVRPLSRLESLPVEILQVIFLFSLEINLPRASLYLGRALASEILYSWLIKLVFSSTNAGSRSGFFTPDFLPPELNFWALRNKERQRLQTTILSCRWCTLSLMRKCQREYIEHTLRLKTAGMTMLEKHRDIMSNLDPYFADPIAMREEESEDSEDDFLFFVDKSKRADLMLFATLPESSTTAPLSSIPRVCLLTIKIWFHTGVVHIQTMHDFLSFSSDGHDDVFRLPCSPVHAPARIPDKLLKPPWLDEQFDFLKVLSAGGFYFDEDDYSQDRSGRVNARLIRKHRVEPLRRLLGMSFRSANCRVPSPWPLLDYNYDAAIRHGRGPGDPVVQLILDERWDNMGTTIKCRLLEHVGESTEDLDY